jgi:hypothetical protein
MVNHVTRARHHCVTGTHDTFADENKEVSGRISNKKEDQTKKDGTMVMGAIQSEANNCLFGVSDTCRSLLPSRLNWSV